MTHDDAKRGFGIAGEKSPARPSVAVVTLNKGRDAHLARLLEGLGRGRPPDEVIVVEMGGGAGGADGAIRVAFPTEGLPLAAARNAGRAAATAEILVFLDVDCIPSADLVDALADAVGERDGLVCCEILYLPHDAVTDGWTEAGLAAVGIPHPARRFTRGAITPAPHPGLFWSLAFAVRAETFDLIGGFDEAFTGYGAEDTDFGVRADALGVPILFCGQGRAFHQRHEGYDPPLQHVADIARNAVRFHRRHGSWPMRAWLDAFAAMGLIIVRDDGRIDRLRDPTTAELASARLTPDCAF